MKQTWQKKSQKYQHFLLKFCFLQNSYSIKSLDRELSPKSEQNYKQVQDTVFLSDFTSQSFSSILEHTLCSSHSHQCYHSCHNAIPSLGESLHNHEREVPHTFSCLLGKSNPLLRIPDHFRKQIDCSHYSNN